MESFLPQKNPVRWMAKPLGLVGASFAAITLLVASTTCCRAAEAMKNAPGAYDAATAYPIGSVVLGVDGNAYRAVQAVKAKDPTSVNESWWQLAHAGSDLVLDVPGRFKTVQQAWKFLDGATIAVRATVTVQVAPGKYEFQEELALDHPFGRQIVISGAGPKPDRCTLVFAGTHGLVVRDGNHVTIRNLMIEEKAAKPPKDKSGLFLANGASVALEGCFISGFWSGCFIADGSRLRATDCRLETTTGWAGVEVRNSSTAMFVRCQVEQKLPAGSAFKAGTGYIALNNSSMWCDDCRATGWVNGFDVRFCSSAILNDCVANENRGMGASVCQASSMCLNQGKFSESEIGVHVEGSTAEINGTTISDNKRGLHVFGTSYVMLSQNRSTFRGNGIAIESKFGGKGYGIPPEFSGNDEDMKASASGRDVLPEEHFLWNR